MKQKLAKIATSLALAGLISGISACQYADPDQVLVVDPKRNRGPNAVTSVFGQDGLQLFGSKSEDEFRGGPGIGVTSYLWRASLDTISFMPLSSADPFGGVIITDWYAPPETPAERFKMTIYILARTLRADGLRVSVFRQERKEPGVWVDSAINPATVTSLENKILERARQLRTGGFGE
ncbi:MAG: hypothetical protein CMM31_02110 [Rhodospirillaceae bacterium]|nr:hypothetical protein [Rhodospirillaceae bacterium]